MMANNSTTINKMNNHSLNTEKGTITYDLENPGPDFGQAQNCGRVKLVNRIQTLLSW
jgi:hypothetical protein